MSMKAILGPPSWPRPPHYNIHYQAFSGTPERWVARSVEHLLCASRCLSAQERAGPWHWLGDGPLPLPLLSKLRRVLGGDTGNSNALAVFIHGFLVEKRKLSKKPNEHRTRVGCAGHRLPSTPEMGWSLALLSYRSPPLQLMRSIPTPKPPGRRTVACPSRPHRACACRSGSPRHPWPLPLALPPLHLNTAPGLVQAVQSELQVGAPSRHHAGAGHVAELGDCVRQPSQQSVREETGSHQVPGRLPRQHRGRAPCHWPPYISAESGMREGRDKKDRHKPCPEQPNSRPGLWAGDCSCGEAMQHQGEPSRLLTPGTASGPRGELGGDVLRHGVGARSRARWNLAPKPQPPLSCVSGLVVTSPHGFQTREATCSSAATSALSWSSGISA